jgi:hypothetical protein
MTNRCCGTAEQTKRELWGEIDNSTTNNASGGCPPGQYWSWEELHWEKEERCGVDFSNS